ncbi:MAG: hypothetical protein ISR56_11330 [Bacteroidales bacterium]|nr:hypothetical protein [Bacteroidales bacterium]
MKIYDNGVGRDQVKQLTESSTTRGLKIVDKIIHAYQEIKQIMINYTITDLFHESRPSGTKVDIYITMGKSRKKLTNMFER